MSEGLGIGVTQDTVIIPLEFILGGLSAIAAIVVAFFTARTSGRRAVVDLRVAEAAERASFRASLLEEVNSLRGAHKDCVIENQELRDELDKLRHEVRVLRNELAEYKRQGHRPLGGVE